MAGLRGVYCIWGYIIHAYIKQGLLFGHFCIIRGVHIKRGPQYFNSQKSISLSRPEVHMEIYYRCIWEQFSFFGLVVSWSATERNRRRFTSLPRVAFYFFKRAENPLFVSHYVLQNYQHHECREMFWMHRGFDRLRFVCKSNSMKQLLSSGIIMWIKVPSSSLSLCFVTYYSGLRLMWPWIMGPTAFYDHFTWPKNLYRAKAT